MVGKRFSMADVWLMAWLSTSVMNELFTKEFGFLIRDEPWIKKFWDTHCQGDLKEYFEKRTESIC